MIHCNILLTKRSLLVCVLVISLASCESTPKQFTLITADESGLQFRNDLLETQHNNIMTYEYSYNGGGVAVGDINGDSLPDIYFSGNTVPNKLFLNEGAWHFRDVTEQSGTRGRNDWKTGVSMADVNGDGWLDIYVCYSGNAPEEGYERPVIRDHPKRANQLFINSGCAPGGIPNFTESAEAYGISAPGTFSTQAYFLDYDLDGDLDLFLLNHANMFYSAFLNTRRLRNLRHPYFGNKLYRNDSSPGMAAPRFTEISAEAGIHGSGLNFGLSAAISDLNQDGYPDIYVTNDYEEQDFCYINNGDGTFREVSKEVFGHLSKYGMGSDIADLNNDGLQEVVVLDMLPEDNRRQKLLKGPDEYDRYSLAVDSGYHHQYMRNTLQLNRGVAPDGLPRFSEIGQLSGISNTDWSWAPLAADFDNDGMKDLFITNGFLRDFNNLDFIKYNADAYAEARASRRSIDYLKLVQQLPSTKLANYAFRNERGFRFSDVTQNWNLNLPTVSHGAAYADLDNDGDLDLVVNNLNDQALLYRNNSETLQQNHYISIGLKGPPGNSAGLGAKISIDTDSREIFQEAWFTRGYQSSVDPRITVGLGNATAIKKIEVRWPDGRVSVVQNLTPNRSITISYEQSQVGNQTQPVPGRPLLEEIRNTGLDFAHRENAFVDFKVQRLLHYQVSRLGGKFAKGDVNRDGNDDVFFGGAVGQPGVLFLGRDDGTFKTADSQPWAVDSLSEDVDAIFFDADKDGDEDLYVISGGSEFVSDAPMYQDRLYINEGTGVFRRNDEALPAETVSGGTVAAADFDHDGDIDLFIGGRLVPGNYGLVPRSFLLRNDSRKGRIVFTDATLEHGDALATPGMVTSAQWTDFNSDGWPDLMIVGEWMPVRLFENREGHLSEQTDIVGLTETAGWWCSIASADVDSDGDMDYLLGNAGMNTQFKASPEQPVQLFAGDFNHDGVVDPVINYYIQGKSYPMPTRDELLDQVSALKKKFVRYEDYALATMTDIATEEQLNKTHVSSASRLESSWLENRGEDGFGIHVLPELAQFSPINGFIQSDFTGDGRQEILAAGNFYPYKPQLGRSDASYGTVMQYRDGEITTDGVRANVWLDGDIRHIDLLHFRTGIKRILVSRNNDRPSLYAITPQTNTQTLTTLTH